MARSVNSLFMRPLLFLEPYPCVEKCKLFFYEPFWLLEPYPCAEKRILYESRGNHRVPTTKTQQQILGASISIRPVLPT